MFKLMFTKDAIKDYTLLRQKPALKRKADQLLEILENNPFENPPKYEKLKGNLNDVYSRRINIQHHLVYMVDIKNKRVKIIALYTHYE